MSALQVIFIIIPIAAMLGWLVFYIAYQGGYVQGAGYGVALALAWVRSGQAVGVPPLATGGMPEPAR